MRYLSALIVLLSAAPLAPLLAQTDMNPQHFNALDAAENLYRASKIDEAETIIQKAITSGIKSHRAHHLLLLIHATRGDFDLALAQAEKASAFEEGKPLLTFYKAEIEFLRKDFKAASDLYSQHLTTQKNDDYARFKWFLCLLKTDRSALVEKELENLFPHPRSPLYYMAEAALAFSKERPDEGSRNLKSASDIYRPDEVRLFEEPLIFTGLADKERLQGSVMTLEQKGSPQGQGLGM